MPRSTVMPVAKAMVYGFFSVVWVTMATSQEQCPENCTCSHGSLQVDCSAAGLNSIPTNIPNTVEVLLLDNNPIERIPPKTFINLTKLAHLSLHRCNLTTIAPDAFHGVRSLQVLILSHNNLHEIPANVLESAKDTLSHLSVAHTHLSLESLCPALVGILALDSLDLTHINSRDDLELPDTFSELTSLRTLHMDHNAIILSNTSFAALSNVSLEYLSLRHCEISNVSAVSFVPLAALRELDVSGSRVSVHDASRMLQGLTNATSLAILTMDYVFNKPHPVSLGKHFFEPLHEMRLENLSFVGNDRAFDGGVMHHRMFAAARSVRLLLLDHCGLTSIPENAFHNLKHLKKLGLSQNLLTCYRNEDCGFLHTTYESLEQLDLSLNSIETATSHVTFRGGAFRSLDSLLLRGNKITRLKEGMFININSLTSLDLSQNPIHDIEQDWLQDMTDLDTLYLNGSYSLNRLGPRLFHGARRLQYINLAACVIEAVHPMAFKGPRKLHTIILRDNTLDDKALEGVHLDSHNISAIDLGHNLLTYIPVFVTSQLALKDLYLDLNYINDTAPISNATSLEIVDLSSNLLSKLSRDFFETEHPNLKSAVFERNPFYCGCDFENLHGILTQMNVSLVNEDNHLCQNPPNARGVNIFRFDRSHWDCIGRHVMVPLVCVICTVVAGMLVLLLLRKPQCRTREIEWRPNMSCCTNCYSQLRQSVDASECTEDSSGL